MIVRKFENSFIVSFPQTVNFSTTNAGKKLLLKSKRIYSKHSGNYIKNGGRISHMDD